MAETDRKSNEGHIAIELRNGIRVEIDDQVDGELLRQVVGVLQSC